MPTKHLTPNDSGHQSNRSSEVHLCCCVQPGRPATYHPQATNGDFYSGQLSGSHCGVSTTPQAAVHAAISPVAPTGCQTKVQAHAGANAADSTCANLLPPDAACATSMKGRSVHSSEHDSSASHSILTVEANTEDPRQHQTPSCSSCLRFAGQETSDKEQKAAEVSQLSLQASTDSAVQHASQPNCSSLQQDSIQHSSQHITQTSNHLLQQTCGLQHGLEGPLAAGIETASNSLLSCDALQEVSAEAGQAAVQNLKGSRLLSPSLLTMWPV